MRRNIATMYVVQFLFGMHIIGAVMVLFLTQWGGITAREVLLLQAWFVLWVSLFEIPTGAVADRWGRKTSIALGFLVLAVGLALYAARPDVTLFFAAEFLWALGSALISGADHSLMYDTLKEAGEEHRAGVILGRMRIAFLLGLLVSSPLGALLASRVGLRATMMGESFTFLSALAATMFFREPPRTIDRTAASYFATLFAGVRLLRHRPALRILALNYGIVGARVMLLVWLSQIYLDSIQAPMLLFGWVKAGYVSVQIAAIAALPQLYRLFASRRRYLLWSAALPGIGYVLIVSSPWLLLTAALIVASIGIGFSRDIGLLELMHQQLESSQRATAVSAASMIRRGTLGALYLLVSVSIVWSITAIFVGVGAALLGASFAFRRST